MKIWSLKRISYVLIVLGLIGVSISFFAMLITYETGQFQSATSFAERISKNVVPASIGSLLLFPGVVILVVDWLRNRNQQHPNIKQINFNP